MTSAVATTDIEAELSYAFLHAVASKSRASCSVAARLPDNRGIDAQLTSWGPFQINAKKEVDLKIQLKATVATPADSGNHLSYSITKKAQYDDLRETGAYAVPRILVVLFLPKDPDTWLEVTQESLALKKSAYWVSLAGAPEAKTNSVTIHIPKRNLLTPASLNNIFQELSIGKIPKYQPKEAGK